MSFKLALRFLVSGRRTTLIVSLIALLGVLLGSCAILLTTGIFYGFQKKLKEEILSQTPHLIINPLKEEYLKDVLKALKEEGEVVSFYDYRLYNGIISVEGKLQVVNVKAIGKLGLKFLKDKILEGDGSFLVVGKGLKELYSLKEGSEVQLVAPFGEETPLGFVPRVERVKVSGFFYTGTFEQDYSVVYLKRELAKKLFKDSFYILGVEAYLKEPYSAQRVKERLLKKLRGKALINSWIDLNSSLFNALELERLGLFTVLFLMVVIASFNITSLLFMKAKEKVKEVAVLRVFGLEERGVLTIFLFMGLTLGLVGFTLGSTLALILSFFINEYKLIRVPREVYMMSYIPCYVQVRDFLLTFLGTIILSLISSYLPARNISREKPATLLRNE